MKRASGVLMPIFSLPGDYSTGSFGQEAFNWIDFLSQNGFSYWQILPYGITDSFHSPYQSYSAFSGNPYFIDLPTLAKQGFLTAAELQAAKQKTPYVCEYERLEKERVALLKKAAARVSAADKQTIQNWAAETHGGEVARFMALKEKNGGKCWSEWTELFPDPDVEFAWQFMQYHFFAQWEEVRAYAKQKGVSIIGDLPIYVSFDSADVWSHKEQFMLDADGKPTHVAGCPPDYFAKDGQLWGNPLYAWDKMKADGFSWWKDRMQFTLSAMDGVRLDHFRGFESFWAVPADAKTAAFGSWVKGPGMDFVNAIKEVAEAMDGDKLIIAEDLGDITPEVIKLVEDSGFPGMRVLQFGFLGGNNPHLPHNYIKNCVSYSGTHDNNTLLGYLWEMPEHQRKQLLAYCGVTRADWGDAWQDIMRVLMGTHSDLVIFPVQDLLGYGSDTRVNKPGIAEENWQVRFTADQLKTVNTKWLRELHQLFYR